jgi:hypothetical protein
VGPHTRERERRRCWRGEPTIDGVQQRFSNIDPVPKDRGGVVAWVKAGEHGRGSILASGGLEQAGHIGVAGHCSGEVADEVLVGNQGWGGVFCAHEGVVKLKSSLNCSSA